ncbi:uncharacterized protein FSUBG_10785 [Fusarium subglutinans]|uniref:Uncharacterized protein n=1 Tax=Gibberella subglutinans TaxID=42677 RepID=A0A8H5LEY5_GIBSU|nr:uncharacterized protein FSUBG_10785 [Fusarium subglutinans]KAF5590569.1 hypothetical protein FSUBG_10785 [Fusarium subglutinans]
MNEGVEYIRVVIPVTGTWLESNETITLPAVDEADGSKTDVSVDASHPTLLFIPGSLTSPVLPAVRSLDQSQQWTFRRYLALSRMYTAPEPADGSQVSVSSDDPVVSVLVVEGKPRFDLTGGSEDASFVLEGALLLPTKSSNPYVLAGVGVNIIFKAKDSAVQELLVNVQHVESHDTS